MMKNILIAAAIIGIALAGVGYYKIQHTNNSGVEGSAVSTSRESFQNARTLAETASTTQEAVNGADGSTVSDISAGIVSTGKSGDKIVPNGTTKKKAVLAGGCFWCVESDLQKYTGVINVVSGYAGGTGDNPTYSDYASRGFREVVEVTYNPTQVSYENLVEYVVRHSDATDPDGSFHDRGPQYTSAAYYSSPVEKQAAEKVVARINERKLYGKALALYIEPIKKFWPAEEYHQDYSIKNPLKYSYYRFGSGRDAFIKKYWGDDTTPIPTPEIVSTTTTATTKTMTIATNHPWEHFVKPTEAQLRAMLTPLQYKVTQENGTENSVKNEYDKNYDAGIYVDIVSGEPLYSSKDKFDSGTGWPSFVKPITVTAVVEKVDKGFFSTRTEIRSRIADSHVGHVFDDGPKDRGGKRYCMNSAAMKFIAKADMEKLGYGDYLKFVE